MMEFNSEHSIGNPLPEAQISWRLDAVKIVEELLQAVAVEHFNLLLDLRGQLKHGEDWILTLDLFLRCRRQLEAEHYLPMYRLRQLLTHSLQIQIRGNQGAHLRRLLRMNYRSFAAIQRAMRREVFEYQLDEQELASADFQIVEALT
jgi:hypothetical protein